MKEYTLKDLGKKVGSILADENGWKVDVKGRRVHLAILVEPYLSLILNGTKTIESRFSMKRTLPFKNVSRGDILLLKKSSGNVVGACLVKKTWFFEMDSYAITRIGDEFAERMCIQKSFWGKINSSSYASLMEIEDVIPLEPFKVLKKDGRPWVIIKELSLLDFTS